MNKKALLFMLALFVCVSISADILIPMDLSQSNHLKAYGIAFYALQ